MSQFKDTEREDKTSASSFGDDFACLGRRNFINSLPPEAFQVESDSTGTADYGNAVHAALENPDLVVKLDDDQLDTYNAIMIQDQLLLNQWLDEHKIEAAKVAGREERFWITDYDFTKLTSAKLDRYWIEGVDALIIDVKSLFAPRLPRAYDSWQLRVQAVALWQEYDTENARVAYNSPNKFGRKTDVAEFKGKDLQRFFGEIKLALRLMNRPDAPRTPGPQCRYCPGRLYCPEALSMSIMPTIVAQAATGIEKTELYERVGLLGIPDLVFLFQRKSIINSIMEAVASRLKDLPEDLLRDYGLMLTKGKDTSKVEGKNIKAVCEALVMAGLPEDEVWECLSLNSGALNELAAKFKQNETKKAAVEWVKSITDQFKTRSEGEKILREI